jgi:hypothetical protein
LSPSITGDGAFPMMLFAMPQRRASFVTGDLSQGHPEEAMRDAEAALGLLIVLASQVWAKLPPG